MALNVIPQWTVFYIAGKNVLLSILENAIDVVQSVAGSGSCNAIFAERGTPEKSQAASLIHIIRISALFEPISVQLDPSTIA